MREIAFGPGVKKRANSAVERVQIRKAEVRGDG